ncbi:MAG TPA: hypothetical protein VGF86_11900 [Candidatus Tumulicola sp.]|jgi:hypothetical protein
MLPPDLAFALLINRTTDYYQAHPPVYMTYTEHTHVTAPSLGRAQDLNRSIAVRVADNFAVMQDLPDGGHRTGQAFPIVAYFDPLSAFQFSYFANLKRVDITIQRGQPYVLATPPPDPSVNAVVAYNSYWDARYAPDSTEAAVHLLIDPTARVAGSFYPSEVVEDPQTHLPSHIEVRVAGSNDMVIALDYKVIEGHWVIVHGTFSATEHAVVLTFKVIADVTFSDIAFPAEAPDPRLAGSPSPPPSPAARATPPGR